MLRPHGMFMKKPRQTSYHNQTTKVLSPDRCGSEGLAPSHKQKGHWLGSGQGNAWVVGQDLVGSIDVSLPLFLPAFPSL